MSAPPWRLSTLNTKNERYSGCHGYGYDGNREDQLYAHPGKPPHTFCSFSTGTELHRNSDSLYVPVWGCLIADHNVLY